MPFINVPGHPQKGYREIHCEIAESGAGVILPGYKPGAEQPYALQVYDADLRVVATILLTEEQTVELREALDGMPGAN
jgi:hypothetical protein